MLPHRASLLGWMPPTKIPECRMLPLTRHRSTTLSSVVQPFISLLARRRSRLAGGIAIAQRFRGTKIRGAERMCGLAGVVALAGRGRVAAPAVHAMADALSHRGPDDDGFLEEPGVGLAS